MRRLLRILLLVLVLITVAMASALMAMRFAIHGREVRVPRLAGLTQTEAERTLASSGLMMNVENSFYSAEVPRGLVLSQYPPPNDKVRRGWRVRVAMSQGAQVSAVPELVGESPRAAELNLRRQGFDIARTALLPRVGTEMPTVIAQSPQSTSQPIAMPKISLLLSAPEETEAFVMPSLIGRSGEAAAELVRGAGFKVEQQSSVVVSADANIIPGNVVAQIPPAGAKIARGGAVMLSVAQSSPPLLETTPAEAQPETKPEETQPRD